MGIVHKVISRGVLALAFTGLLACAHSSKTTVEEIVTEQSAEFDDAGNLVLPIDVTVTPVKGPSGTSYTFKYSSRYRSLMRMVISTFVKVLLTKTR